MADPTTCTCRNICNRAETGGGRAVRNSCPCLSKGNFCSSLCKCGNGNSRCSNRLGRGGTLEKQLLDSGEIEPFQVDEEDLDESLIVAFGDDPPFVVPGTVGEMDRSLQCEAEGHLDSSFVEGRDKDTTHDNEGGASGSPSGFSSEMHDSSADHQVDHSDTTATTPCLPSGLSPDVICAMPQNQLAHIVCRLFKMYPELTAAAMEPQPPEPPRDEWPRFCKCGRCRPMPTTKEQLCCRRGLRPGACVTVEQSGLLNQVVLSLAVLQQAVHDHNDLNVVDDDPNNNDTLRHMAYRKYIIWRFGYLGPGERRVIPSCVVWKIRDKYPSADGTYTGYKPARQ